MLALQVKCERTLPDVMMTYIDPDSSRVSPGRTSLLTLPGRHAIGPHGGDLEWQLVTTEEDLYQMLCVARKCQGKLDKGDITLHDGTRQSVLLLNVAVFRFRCNIWDIQVDQGGKARVHSSGLPGVDAKDPAPDFGYTHDAQHAVTGACLEVDAKAENRAGQVLVYLASQMCRKPCHS